MAYDKVMTQDEKDDTIVEFLAAQEHDGYCHELNIERYTAMLPSLPDGPWKDRISNLLAQEQARKEEVDSIIVATESQMPTGQRLTDAKSRLSAKKAAQSSQMAK
jgi:hypothetical protein